VVTAGLGGVGKSATVIYLMRGIFVETYDPTIEDLHRKQLRVDGFAYMLAILDTAGQEEFSAMQGEWYRTGEAFLLMYAIDDRVSFDGAAKVRLRILQAKDYRREEFSIIVCANKNDLEEQRVVSREEGRAFADEEGSAFFEISAKEGFNVVEVFEKIVRDVNKIRQYKKEEADKQQPIRRSISLLSVGRKASMGRRTTSQNMRGQNNGYDDFEHPRRKSHTNGYKEKKCTII